MCQVSGAGPSFAKEGQGALPSLFGSLEGEAPKIEADRYLLLQLQSRDTSGRLT